MSLHARKTLLASGLAVVAVAAAGSFARARVQTQAPAAPAEHRVLATSKTSTMEKELNEAAEAGFRFRAAMGGETAFGFGGNEVVVVMTRASEVPGSYAYRLLATNKTSTMQKELQEAGGAGFEYVGQTVFNTLFGSDEVVVILERDKNTTGPVPFEYRLFATSKTSTMQKELLEAESGGYEVIGLTVGQTAMGGKELVAITRRPQTR